jgi:hypothetical protein
MEAVMMKSIFWDITPCSQLKKEHVTTILRAEPYAKQSAGNQTSIPHHPTAF